ncbi:MAG: CBASS cGAMP-activated phospholipase [Rickettsiales bacterium]
MRKILCIDGGGIKGIFPAAFLSDIEEQIDGEIVDYFDLIVGTSTGGIIAIALGLGLKPSEILQIYTDLGNKVFSETFFGKIINFIKFKARYDNKALEECLVDALGDRVIGESKVRLVIPSASITTGEVYIYKTAHNERFRQDYKRKAVDVALATSAAPTYFPTHFSEVGIPLIDGGIWANNPCGVAAVEACGVLGWEPENVKLFSLGCTEESFDYNPPFWNIKKRILKFLNVIMQAQSSSSYGAAQLLLGHGNVTRITYVAPEGKFKLDGTKTSNILAGLGKEKARHEYPKLKDVFFKEKAELFCPIYSITK